MDKKCKHRINPSTLKCGLCGMSSKEVEAERKLEELEGKISKDIKGVMQNIQDLPKKLKAKAQEALLGYKMESTHGTSESIFTPAISNQPEDYVSEWFCRRAVVLILHHGKKSVAWGVFPDKLDVLEDVCRFKMNAAIARITQYYMGKGYTFTEPPTE